MGPVNIDLESGIISRERKLGDGDNAGRFLSETLSFISDTWASTTAGLDNM